MTYKGYQEPVAARTRSQASPPPITLPFDAQKLPLNAPVAARKIS